MNPNVGRNYVQQINMFIKELKPKKTKEKCRVLVDGINPKQPQAHNKHVLGCKEWQQSIKQIKI